jgi:hypothetical protein
MTTPALRLKDFTGAADSTIVVHYGCESWFEVKDRPVAISCIAVLELQSGASKAFSVIDHKNNPEQRVLQEFFDWIRSRADAPLLTWNMNMAEFSFDALSKRYRYLLDEAPPYMPPEDRRFDLDQMIALRYGRGFADHPKFYTLASMNGFNKRFMLTGIEEAERLKSGEHGEIRRSVIEKTKLIAFLAHLFLEGSLETKTSGRLLPFAGEKLDSVQVITTLAERTVLVRRQLLERHGGRATLDVKDEYDAQDLFHSLLRVFIDDIRAEEVSPTYAGSSKRIDFVLPEFGLAIELKHSRATLTHKELGNELSVDIAAYASHPKVRHLVCLVFDPSGHILNPRGVENDLSGVRDKLLVTVRIIDR